MTYDLRPCPNCKRPQLPAQFYERRRVDGIETRSSSMYCVRCNDNLAAKIAAVVRNSVKP